jgi:hypothetical protein
MVRATGIGGSDIEWAVWLVWASERQASRKARKGAASQANARKTGSWLCRCVERAARSDEAERLSE